MSARSFNINKTTKQGNIQVLRGDRGVQVTLHRTNVFILDYVNGVIELNSGGWQTTTTKTAINRAFSQLGIDGGVSQKKGQWYVSYNGQVFDFKDGMVLSSSTLQNVVSNMVG